MKLLYQRPYLIIPKLIEQPTWGGNYILEMKGWGTKPELQGKKIGQSYELFGKSKLAVSVVDTRDERFTAELGNADNDKTITSVRLIPDTDYVVLQDMVKSQNKFPLLIKMTQAAGNSFQLHIKPSITHNRWKPKAESWYYFEEGFLTFGIKNGINLEDYKKVCHTINDYMINVSNKIKQGELLYEKALEMARDFIKSMNPWQFVNTHTVPKDTVLDLSLGGLHHSWEEDKSLNSLGNILYEIQQDVMDPISTIRSFDQGKIRKDGSIREIHIDDYFQFLDTNPDNNNINNMIQQKKGERLLTTPRYCMNILKLDTARTDDTDGSFCHLFVREGEVEISASEGSVRLTQGHSCFIPQETEQYQITPKNHAVLLKTFIE